MDNIYSICGAKAIVYLKSQNSLENVSEKISDSFLYSKFRIENREEPPFDYYGSAELLGFEVWLNKCHHGTNSYYSLEMETSHSLVFNDKMYDLSPWLARYINDICKIEAFVSQDECKLAITRDSL